MLVVAMSVAVSGVTGASTRAGVLSSYATPAQVVAAVKASLSLTTLPTDATPSLTVLSTNGDWGGDLQDSSKCPLLTTNQYKFTYSDCYFGDLSSHFVVALVGDSRARMILDVLNQLGVDEGFKLLILAKSGCPSAIATFAVNNDGTISRAPWPACTDFHSEVFSDLSKIKPKVIIVSTSIDLQIMDPTENLATPSQVHADVLAFLKKLPSASHTVVLGGFPQPAPTYNPSVCLSRNPTQIQECSFMPSTQNAEEIAADESAAKDAKVAYQSQIPYFCDVTCPAVIGSIIPYTVDAYHADKTYYNYLTDVIWTLIDPTMIKARF